MRLIFSLLVAACFCTAALPTASAQTDAVSIRAILVSASRDAGTTDRRLANYESTLRRILRFESFQQLGAGNGRAAVPGEGRISMGQGHTLSFTTEASSDDRIRVQLTWSAGDGDLMRTGLVLRPGVPAVLGGPARNSREVYAVILVAE